MKIAKEFSIRLAVVSDIQDIVRVHESSWKAAYEHIFDLTYIDSCRFRSFWEQKLVDANDMYYVVEEENNIVCVFSIEQRDSGSDIAELGLLYVESDMRRQGVGKVVIRYLVEQAKLRGIGTIVAQVVSTNTAALAFYQKHGFTAICTEPPKVFELECHDVVWIQMNIHDKRNCDLG